MNISLFDIKEDESLLSKEESNAIKGVLILLIILGHDIPFVRLTDSWMVMVWMYLFHIHSFFLLPYFYPLKMLSAKRMGDLLTRFYVPFIVFSSILVSFRIFLGNGQRANWVISDILLCLIGGGSLHLKSVVGVQFLWFLPAMFMCSLVREVFMYLKGALRYTLLLIGIGITVLSLYPSIILPAYLDYLLLGFRFLIFGISYRLIFLYGRFSFGTVSILFFLGSFVFFVHYRYCLYPFYSNYPIENIYRVLCLLMTFSFLQMLYLLRKHLSTVSLFVSFGENSLLIYLFHTFCGYICNWCLVKCGLVNWISAPCCFFFMAIASLSIAKTISRVPIIKTLFFPNNWKDFSSSFGKLFAIRA